MAHRLMETDVTASTTLKEKYRYDGLGRRVYQERPGGAQTLSIYSQAGQMLFRFDNLPTQRTREHVYLAGSLVATIDHDWPSNAVTATNYQHTDALGSPVAVTAPDRHIVERTYYTPYGLPINHAVEGIGYTGHVMDSATGLTYMQQRYYDPQIGRFLSGDPAKSEFNRYDYAANNPYRFTDPDGRIISVDDPNQRKDLLDYINTHSTTQFKFRANGSLARDTSKHENKQGSAHFAKQLVAGIRSSGRITISVTKTMTGTDDSPAKPLELHNVGEGYTQNRYESPGRIDVGISGQAVAVEGANGKSLIMSAADVLMHELLAHAIPQLVGSDTGNGIENENIARGEVGQGLRAADPCHTETRTCP